MRDDNAVCSERVWPCACWARLKAVDVPSAGYTSSMVEDNGRQQYALNMLKASSLNV